MQLQCVAPPGLAPEGVVAKDAPPLLEHLLGIPANPLVERCAGWSLSDGGEVDSKPTGKESDHDTQDAQDDQAEAQHCVLHPYVTSGR